MKIYYICSVGLSNYDAQRTHILEVVSEMHKAGEDVTLFLPGFRGVNMERFPFKTSYIPITFTKGKLKFVEYEIRLVFTLWKECITNRPDILYSRKGFLSLVPVILSRILSIKSITEVNGIIADEVKIGFGLPDPLIRLFALIEKIVYSLADKVVVVTEGLKTYLNRNYGIDEAKIEVIHNGVNVDRFIPKAMPQAERLHLGFVGHLVPWHGLEFLIRSIPDVICKKKDLKYLIIGDGQLRGSLEALVRSLNIAEYVEFTGTVSPDKVVDYINRCDICFIPAVRARNEEIGLSPLKLYEYLACGKAVIASNIKGLDIIEKYHLGRIVEPENVEALAAATLALIENNNERKEIGLRARALAVEHFSWKKTTAKVLNLCQRLANEPPNKKNK